MFSIVLCQELSYSDILTRAVCQELPNLKISLPEAVSFRDSYKSCLAVAVTSSNTHKSRQFQEFSWKLSLPVRWTLPGELISQDSEDAAMRALGLGRGVE
jgi:hypothetical protein